MTQGAVSFGVGRLLVDLPDALDDLPALGLVAVDVRSARPKHDQWHIHSRTLPVGAQPADYPTFWVAAGTSRS